MCYFSNFKWVVISSRFSQGRLTFLLFLLLLSLSPLPCYCSLRAAKKTTTKKAFHPVPHLAECFIVMFCPKQRKRLCFHTGRSEIRSVHPLIMGKDWNRVRDADLWSVRKHGYQWDTGTHTDWTTGTATSVSESCMCKANDGQIIENWARGQQWHKTPCGCVHECHCG